MRPGAALAALVAAVGIAASVWPAPAAAGLRQAGAAGGTVGQAGGRSLAVGPGGTHTTLAEALGAARDGDVITVRGGVHPGPVRIERSVRLLGADGPVIDGSGRGNVVEVAAPGVEVSGFTVRDSGSILDQENSGILVVGAPGTVIRHNRLEDVLFGINLQQAAGSVVENNVIIGKPRAPGVRGDLIKVWYSPRTRLVGNTARQGRDVLLWFSDGTLLARNTITDSRYGIHFMYTNETVIAENVLSGNSVGTFAMYSVGLTFTHNLVARSRGPSGYALAFKDSERIVARENWLLGNRVGVYLDASPYSRGVRNRFEGNVIAGNDTGALLMPALAGNDFAANSFIDNLEQMALTTRGAPGANDWAPGGAGNYWSDYAGYDAGGDGAGDVPYQPRSLFEDLMVRYPELRWFRFSPAALAVDLAARTFPSVQPEPKLTDPAPRVLPALPAASPVEPPPAGPLGAASLAMLAAAGAAWGALHWPVRVRRAAICRSEGVSP